MPGTCCATRVAAFSGYGSASPYDDDVVAPEWAATTTTSTPKARIRGTQILARSTRPGKVILPSTLALSQMAIPGLVRPRMPHETFRRSSAPGPRCRAHETTPFAVASEAN